MRVVQTWNLWDFKFWVIQRLGFSQTWIKVIFVDVILMDGYSIYILIRSSCEDSKCFTIL